MPKAKASKSASYKNNFANMPQEVVHEVYPKRSYPMNDDGYPDNISLIDKNASKDAQALSRSMMNK